MNTYLTERYEITEHGDLVIMCGEDIQAYSIEEAISKEQDGFFVIGELLGTFNH